MYYDGATQRYYIALNMSTNAGAGSLPVWGGESLNVSGGLFVLDNEGNELWRQLSSPYNPTSTGATVMAVATDNESNVYITGNAGNAGSNIAHLAGYTFTQNNQSPYLIKLDADGGLLWGTNINYAPGNQNNCIVCYGRDIAINGDEVAIATSLGTNVWGDIAMPRVANHGRDPVLVRFNKETGEPLVMNDILGTSGNSGTEELMAVVTDHNGNYVVAGYGRHTLFLNHDTVAPLPSLGGDSDFFIAKLGNSPCTPPMSAGEAVKQEVKLYPNPVSGMLYIEAENLQSYEVCNLIGQKLKPTQPSQRESFARNNGVLSIDMSDLSQGTYLIRLTTQNGKVITKKVIKE